MWAIGVLGICIALFVAAVVVALVAANPDSDIRIDAGRNLPHGRREGDSL